jgi:uncharacterized RDD family membrane protein YckC
VSEHDRSRLEPAGAEPGGGAGARGGRLGLPAAGPGSLAGAGRRIGAFLLDAVLCTLVAGLFTAPQPPRLWSLLVFGCEYTFFAATFGQTPGMAALRLALVRVDGPGAVRPGPVGTAPVGPGPVGPGPVRLGPVRLGGAGLGRVAVRTLLLILLVPAVIFDSDGRGMHDRLTGTAVVRLR